ncbi:hypothetical protein [Silvibacterium dinghuense]|nr:hypothetical protein [Silvibacterium dinghuense]GGG98653.1 hypothetical protein GCM10011586_12600 [Silvibacterium dinghuense]
MAALAVGMAVMMMTAGCRVQVDKNGDGKDKNVKIDTPLGGLHVRADQTTAADVGLPVYPGATVSADKDGDKSADVHLGFGDWQLRVRAVTYRTGDAQDAVLAFYQKALGRYGDVVRCQGTQAVGTPIVTREGLNCADDEGDKHVHVTHDGDISLKAGSRRHQHIFAIQKSDGAGTKFTLVELQLPAAVSEDEKDAN